MKSHADQTHLSRRAFLQTTTAGLLAMKAGLHASAQTAPKASAPVAAMEAFPWRVIELWHTPDAKLGDWSVHGNFVTWADMLRTTPSSQLGRFVAQVRDWGFNTFSLAWGARPERNPDAMRNFSAYLREQGLRFALARTWAETRRASGAVASLPDGQNGLTEKLCVYKPEVRAYWAERIDRDFEIMPTMGAYRIRPAARNGPWMCPCAECQKRTPRQRTLDAIDLIAGLVQKHGRTLFWEVCQDDPWLTRLEVEHYADLTGKLPANTLVLLKDKYWDFHPGWPRHPVMETIRKDAQGKSPYLTAIQSTGEYRGMHEFPWQMVDEWSQTFRDMANTGQQGAWVTSMLHPETWDHPLNMVNWHAIARLMREPFADPGEIKREWASHRFGAKAAPAIPAILENVTEAARGMYEFDALWTHKHCRFPWLEYLDCHVCGPYREMERIKGTMGMDLPLDMYSAPIAARIKRDPRTRMVFNRVAITPQLKAEAMAQKHRAIERMEQAIRQWAALKDAVPADDHRKIATGLAANRDDTIVFRNMMDLFMDWKLGVLTEAKIDAVLAASRDLRGAIVPEPMRMPPTLSTLTTDPADRTAATLKGFAEQLRKELREPWVEEFWKAHPTGVG